jgi:hypothetical protein
MLARLDRGAVAVPFDQPVLVVGASEVADRLPQLLKRLEALDPEQLLLERLQRLLGDPVRFWFVVEAGERTMPRWSISAW